jgi:SAM-dependent methyltransferase
MTARDCAPSSGDDGAVNWSEELEELHEESSRTHFIDVWTRRAILSRLGPLPPSAVVIDAGCSTGYLLEDLRAHLPDGRLTGFDLVFSGLRVAAASLTRVLVAQADVCRLPLGDRSVDAVVSANLLEHVPDDGRALAEIHRVLRPGARAVLVVPAGPNTYDYYDRYLHHQRRYARHELASRAARAGLEVVEDFHLGWSMYPAFWLVKKRNRMRFGRLEGEELSARVQRDIANTKDSRLGHVACGVEERLLARGVVPPFGIRGLTVVRRPPENAAS